MAQTVVANSTIAGVSSYPIIAAGLTAVLAIAGIAIPPFTIGALVVTQATDISIAAALLSYVTVHFFPDSIAQNIVALAKFAPKVLAMIPKTYAAPTDFPEAPKTVVVTSNINQNTVADAVAVIKTATAFPTEVKS